MTLLDYNIFTFDAQEFNIDSNIYLN